MRFNGVTAFPLTSDHERTLLEIAASAIGTALALGTATEPELGVSEDPALAQAAATFVTLERGEALLGCVGNLEAVEALSASVARNACKAAFADPRAPSVTETDFVVMSIKISVLSRLTPVRARSWRDVQRVLRPERDGVLVEAGSLRATLLPSVWPKVDDSAQFLDVLWHKAGMRPRDWLPGTRVWRYTTEEFSSDADYANS
jgi:AmmeMemoRadiSam system protein A